LFEHNAAMSPVAGSVHPRISLTFPIELMKLRRVYRHGSPLANTGASPNARFAPILLQKSFWGGERKF
jgi:hypothetical protein